MNSTQKFLTAEWRQLAMLNYPIEPKVLRPFVPAGTELDAWREQHWVSVVGFMFLRTRVWGVGIPLHQNFAEVNLRFYVRRLTPEGWRRGVVFIKEIVPRRAIAMVARTLYHEPYVALPVRQRLRQAARELQEVEYAWEFQRQSHWLKLTVAGAPEPLRSGSDGEFITEHYWGYNRQPDGATVEYRVEHPAWRVQEAVTAELQCDVAALYGPAFRDSLTGKPASAFLAEGSPVTVYRGQRLP